LNSLVHSYEYPPSQENEISQMPPYNYSPAQVFQNLSIMNCNVSIHISFSQGNDAVKLPWSFCKHFHTSHSHNYQIQYFIIYERTASKRDEFKVHFPREKTKLYNSKGWVYYLQTIFFPVNQSFKRKWIYITEKGLFFPQKK
jgi:hypothetical protein